MSKKQYKIRHDSKKRTKQIKFHATEEEYNLVKKKAQKFDRSMADFARRAALGVRMASPPSAENLKQYRFFGEQAGVLNDAVLQAHKLREIFENMGPDFEKMEEDNESKLDHLIEVVERMEGILSQIQPVLLEIKQLLVDQWEENKSDLMNS